MTGRPIRKPPLHTWPRWLGLFVIVILAIAYFASDPLPKPAAISPGQSDMALYARIAAGDDYYRTVAEQHRAHGYPLKPFYTVRPPTLAKITHWLGADTMVLAQLLVIATAMVWAISGRIGAGLMMLPGGFLTFYLPSLLHEQWCGILLCLAAAFYREDRYRLTIVCALAALLFREFAIVFFAVFMGFALLEKRWQELRGWSLALLAGCVFYALHAWQVSLIVTATDVPSPGWLQSPGIGWTLSNEAGYTLLRIFDRPVAVVLLLAGVLGWLADRRVGSRVFVFLLADTLFVAIAARPNNPYWQLVMQPLAILGLAFLPKYLIDSGRDVARIWRLTWQSD